MDMSWYSSILLARPLKDLDALKRTSDFTVIIYYSKNLHACWSQSLPPKKSHGRVNAAIAITDSRLHRDTGSNTSIAWGAVTGMGCNWWNILCFPACINMLGSHGIGWTVSLLAATSIPWLYRQLLNTFLGVDGVDMQRLGVGIMTQQLEWPLPAYFWNGHSSNTEHWWLCR